MPKLKTGIVLLEFTPITSAAAAKTYYKARSADYYIKGDDVSATWGGKGCARLGLVGAVKAAAFNRLTENLHPTAKGNQPLTAKMCSRRKVGTDITFHVPKALSCLSEILGEQLIEAVASKCVDEVMAEMEKDAATRVRQGGRDEIRTTGELVWAKVRHRTSRPVNGVPFPLLHFHAVTFNSTYDCVEKQWKALDLGPVWLDATYYEALFSAKLAARMRALGHMVAPTHGQAWTIAGMTPEMMLPLSPRTTQIEERAREEEKKAKKA